MVEFLAALADPEHERHAEMIDWHGDNFDPHAVDLTEINHAIDDAARRWTRPRRIKPT